ncbi:uncharacterized protein METZ01_LOCUS224814 [marine metagenome]|uniref:DNA recombination protein RmuC n=1 Tax=marine metagenome TaxID=408172 RepID=A0A382G9N2_9ZZZZ
MDVLSLIAGAAIGTIFTYTFVNMGRQALRDRMVEAEALLKQKSEDIQNDEEVRKSQESIFEATALGALEKNSESFIKLAKQTFESHEKVTKLQSQTLNDRIQSLHKEVLKTHAETSTVVSGLKQETTQFSKILASPQKFGVWGETTLKNLAEMAGMSSHCDFDIQQTVSDSEGKSQRPDMIVNLPGGRTIAVDAKMNLQHWIAYHNAETDDQRKDHLAHHWEIVDETAKKLGQRNYWQNLPVSPDFVLMFMPDSVYYAAMEHDDELFARAYQNKVCLAPPSLLLPMLRMLANEWTQENINKKSAEIYDMGRLLYKRVGTVSKHLDRLGKGLSRAVKSYNEAVNSIESRLLVTAREFDKMDMNLDKEIENPTHVDILPRTSSAPELQTTQEVPPESD